MRQPDARVVERMSGGGLHELHDAGVVETDQVDPGHAGLPSERGQRLHQGVRMRELAVAVGAEDEEPQGRVGRRQVPEQQQAALVGPLEVVEHQYHWSGLADHGEQTDHGAEQEEPFGVAVRGSRRRQIGDPAGQSGDEAGQFGAVGRHVGLELGPAAHG